MLSECDNLHSKIIQYFEIENDQQLKSLMVLQTRENTC